MSIRIAIADDHQLFIKSLGLLINSFPGFSVVADALNGRELVDMVQSNRVEVDIVLIDVNMPTMDGPETAVKLYQILPLAKTVALSMKADDYSIIKMLKAGCCAYLLKNIHPNELERALLEIHQRGFYNADDLNLKYRRMICSEKLDGEKPISEKELEFLQFASSDLTYKQIATKMNLAERTIDGYRESLFIKFKVQSRVGLVLEAIRRGLVKL